MYSKFRLGLKYLSYYLSAFDIKGHGIHSPFVFEFVTKVLGDKTRYPEYETIEQLRQQLLKDNNVLIVQDFGAGSIRDKTDQRTIASIAGNAAKPARFGQLLYRMVKYYQPRNILELGTSLGLTTSYLSLAKPDSNILTMEGASAVAAKARQNFDKLNIQNISLIDGNFDQSLSSVLLRMPQVDFVFVDGNHRREPTERYFSQLLPAVNSNSILIFDDIHWSRDMEQAWQTIMGHSTVRCSFDLFFVGILFFRKEFKEKQHFSIRF
jgi:predicted O-methyltransferase YrrM